MQGDQKIMVQETILRNLWVENKTIFEAWPDRLDTSKYQRVESIPPFNEQ